MKKHHSHLAWSLAMLAVSVWVYMSGSPIGAMCLTFGSGFMFCEFLNEGIRYYERLIQKAEAPQ